MWSASGARRPPRGRESGVTLAKAPCEYRGGIPTTPILLLRFPDGDVEWRSTRGELPIGTLIRARGTLWRVREFNGDAAYLEEAEAQAGPVGGPPVIPDALGDTPLTVEMLPAV